MECFAISNSSFIRFTNISSVETNWDWKLEKKLLETKNQEKQTALSKLEKQNLKLKIDLKMICEQI